ncbi:hypothetical protein ACI2LF_20975 [Kribbella sp. NPDC020789]
MAHHQRRNPATATLGVPLAQEVAEGKIDGTGTAADVPELVRELVPEVSDLWREHEELTVDGVEVC